MADQWELNLSKDLATIIRINVTKLTRVMRTLSRAHQKQWIDMLKEEINDSCSLLIDEAANFVSIEHLRRNCVKLCDLLEIELTPMEIENRTLFEQKKMLQDKLKDLEDVVLERRTRHTAINLKQRELCRLLGKPLVSLVGKNILSIKVLDEIEEYVNKLTVEKKEIEQEIDVIRRKILNIFKEIAVQPDPVIEKLLASIDNASAPKNKDNLKKLSGYYKCLEEKQKSEEKQQLDSLKTTIHDLYEKCLIPPKERTLIKNFHETDLNLIQDEIKKLQAYWKTNRKMFTFYDKYAKKWTKLDSLAKANSKNSPYQNCTDIRSLAEEICNFENFLIEDAAEFENTNEKPFTAYGQTVPEIIAKFHGSYGTETFIDKGSNKSLSIKVNEYKVKSMPSPKRKKYNNSNETATTSSMEDDIMLTPDEILFLNELELDIDSISNAIESDYINCSPNSNRTNKSNEDKSDRNENNENNFLNSGNDSDLNLCGNISMESTSLDLENQETYFEEIELPCSNVGVDNNSGKTCETVYLVQNSSRPTPSTSTSKGAKQKSYSLCKSGKKQSYKVQPKGKKEKKSSASAPAALDDIRNLFYGMDFGDMDTGDI